ncbi:uncharacterized protein LOC131318530 isoform X1 [Rhododendron vialii]|uniref:uncharacterized protein LOC131318530 isoform X1 n=1 Tax=Rhododendron vialii TaxID=182163 RepID=UPI00265F63BF|nr:uncharacterized protein LOC131318530 isoform X1 [Rhododendron vialii]
MDIFSESPMSFKMNMKSPLASMLKSSISDKLVHFLGDCTDDVLAEYIIVLVRNGKHQIQARDDLEAFLGDKSGEFVSWLWDHLLKCAHQSDSAIGLIDLKDITVTCPHSSCADRDLRRTRSKDVQNHGNGNSDSSLIKNLIPRGPVSPVNEVKTNTVHSEKQRSRNPGEVDATENFHDGSLSHKLSRIGCSTLIPTVTEQSSECIDRSKIANYRGSELPSQLVDFPRREIISRNSEPSTIEPSTGKMYAGNISARSPPRAVEELSRRSKKPRGSVWDRLGKPCEETVVINDNKSVDPLAVAVLETEKEVSDLNTLVVPVPNSVFCGSMTNQGHDLDKSCSGNNTGEHMKLDVGASMMGESHAVDNIGQKRHFGGISSPSSCSVSLLGRRKIQHYNETSKDSKRSNSKSEAAAPALVSQAQDMKERLRKIEREMFTIRTKQLEMKKDGQPHVSSNPGVIKHSEEDVKSRTVFVTNVHFAATKEALSLHFAKCGVVLSVVILTDILNGQPKGSAYITFANKESVDKAVSLSGTSFFSRIVKVIRKVDEAAVGNTPPQRAGKPSQAQSSQMKTIRPFYPSSHLQWCREPLSAPSEPST